MTTRGVSIGALLGTSDSDIYIVPANFNASIISLVLSNNNGTNEHCNVKWFNSATSVTYVLLDNYLMPSHGFIQLENPLKLQAGDKVIANAVNASKIRLSLCIDEEFNPVKRT